MRRIAGLLLVLATVALVAVLSASAGARHSAHAAAAKPFTAKFTYHEFNHGVTHGASTTGIEGRGAFAATLSRHAALEAAVISLVTGVPVNKIAQGGTYVVKRSIDAKGDVSGLAVVKFKAHGLGTLCLSYTAKPGKFVPGTSFVPMSGAFNTLGGTGPAATWRGSLGFKLTSVTGSQTENFGASGSEQASTGKAKHMSTACRHVATLH